MRDLHGALPAKLWRALKLLPLVALLGCLEGTNTGPSGGSLSLSTAAGGHGPTGLGAGQVSSTDLIVAVPSPVSTNLSVDLLSSDTTVVTVPPRITIAAGNTESFVPVTGIRAGTATVTASASGYESSTPYQIGIVQSRLNVELSSGISQARLGAPLAVIVASVDSLGTARPMAKGGTVTLTSTLPAHVSFGLTALPFAAGAAVESTTVTFDSGASYHVTASGPGFAAGDDSVAFVNFGEYQSSNNLHGLQSLGANQIADSGVLVQLPFNVTSTLVAVLTSSDTDVLNVPHYDTIPPGTNHVLVTVFGVGVGSASLSASVPGIGDPQPIAVIVQTPHLTGEASGGMNPGDPVYAGVSSAVVVFSFDSLGTRRRIHQSMQITLASTDPGLTLTHNPITLPAGASSVVDTSVFSTPGTYTVTATSPGWQPYTFTVVVH